MEICSENKHIKGRKCLIKGENRQHYKTPEQNKRMTKKREIPYIGVKPQSRTKISKRKMNRQG